MLQACNICAKERWVLLIRDKPQTLICHSCSARKTARLKLKRHPYDPQTEPKIGEVRYGGDIGRVIGTRYIRCCCPDCGTATWKICDSNDQPRNPKCVKCFRKAMSASNQERIRERSARWKGGATEQLPNGYIFVRLYPDNPYYPMADKRHHVLEHRLVMAQQLGRCLETWEVVHHQHKRYPRGSNEDHADNLPDNLMVVTVVEHLQITFLETKLTKRIKELESRVTLLEAENVLLKAQGLHA